MVIFCSFFMVLINFSTVSLFGCQINTQHPELSSLHLILSVVHSMRSPYILNAMIAVETNTAAAKIDKHTLSLIIAPIPSATAPASINPNPVISALLYAIVEPIR